MGVTIIFAPSDVTAYYSKTPARTKVVGLPEVPVPKSDPVKVPSMPLATSTDGGCDTESPQGSPWTHQIDTLTITDKDWLIGRFDLVLKALATYE